MNKLLSLTLILLVLSACEDLQTSTVQKSTFQDSSTIKLFENIPSSVSGLTFSNTITENIELNAVLFDGMMHGSGVGILDANSDGLPDIYMGSNMQGDKLFLNKGNFKFEDSTLKAGITPTNWSTGIAIVDINNDGHDDIYVCKYLYDQQDRRANMFYLNNGDGTFTESAKQIGINDNGYSIMANFFDYDRDGDLDLYIANQPPNSLKAKKNLKGKVDYQYTDKLYRNDNGKFVNVTEQAGIKNYCYSLSATTLDYNQDGWPDIYVAVDYDEPDMFFKNNGNGTFTDISKTSLKHMSNFSMGVDIADINNDGHLDIYVADMVAEDNLRQKTNMSGMNPERFFQLVNAGYHYQYMFNALQLNNGDGSFSEVAQLSGVSNTDWSWSPLFMDIDKDGYKDLTVTNGLIKDIRNKDFEIWRREFYQNKLEEASKSANKRITISPLEIGDKAPSQKISNYVYQNQGDLGFKKVSEEWGLSKKTWSNGSAYADFDNDGDLDLVINNCNMEADLYKNTASDKGLNNYLCLKLDGPALNKSGIGARIEIEYDDQIQVYECSPYRGYMSSSQRIAHFGLGTATTINEIRVIWPDNKMNKITGQKANKSITVSYAKANEKYTRKGLQDRQVFKSHREMALVHKENIYDDYKKEILLPYKTSTLGPVVCKGDVNDDGLEDVFYGSSTGSSSTIMQNMGNGKFKTIVNPSLAKDAIHEDGGALFFDADGDGDQDLYVSSGGNEFPIGSMNYQDRLYLNNGKGLFTRSGSLPSLVTSNSVVTSLDYDQDGDLDLYVGGRQVPGKYGLPTDSYILKNDKGKFTDVTLALAPMLKEVGMVTAAQVADLNGDGQKELLIAGEWMPLKVITIASKMIDISSQYGLSDTKGWWNTLALGDVDNDGDTDIVAGNLGYNIKYKASKEEPFKVYVDDFDQNGTHDVYLGYYQNGQCFPVRGRQCSSEQLPFVKEKFGTYQEFGLATIDQVLQDHISEKTVVQEAQTFATTVFLNEGGTFRGIALPNETQISPVYGIALDDFDKDGNLDIFLAGNMYNREVETTRSDAGKGCLVSYRDGKFNVKRSAELGISADKDVRGVSTVKSGTMNLLVVANNNAPAQVYSY